MNSYKVVFVTGNELLSYLLVCSFSGLVFVFFFTSLFLGGVHVLVTVLLGAFHHVGTTPVVVLFFELFANLV